MRIGCTFPHEDIGNDPSAIRDFAQAAENLGFSHIMIYDHVLGAVHADRDPPLNGPYTELTPFHEAFVTFGFLAAVTTRIELTTGIVILPQRQTSARAGTMWNTKASAWTGTTAARATKSRSS
jgi:alkanesulfonate monooxygenase SsuD/methylene tetrahydromethanopterin reductase-like flavin-dependent oxidoreductase (luciferase family)